MQNYKSIVEENNSIASELGSIVKNCLRNKEEREYVMGFVRSVMFNPDEASAEVVQKQKVALQVARDAYREIAKKQAERFLENRENEKGDDE